MIVAGGCYRETCSSPPVDEIFGSGGRAALAVAAAQIDVEWHYYCPPHLWRMISRILSSPRITHRPHLSSEEVSFVYTHPLSRPNYFPSDFGDNADIVIEGSSILRFGFMEGNAVVQGSKVVFDPQNSYEPQSFIANGSSADSLAVVLNEREVLALGRDTTESKAAENIWTSEQSNVIVVKSGPRGCRIYINGKLKGNVPSYRSESVYKIGSGDIFSAAFAYHWAEAGVQPIEAADLASRCVARYCNSRELNVLTDSDTFSLVPNLVKDENAKIYVAGPFFTLAELWLVEEVCHAFASLGVQYFSPYHTVGRLNSYSDDQQNSKEVERVVRSDLEGLHDCKALFAIIDGRDPGTFFEIGWAVKHDIPIVAFSQNLGPADLVMIRGSKNCSIYSDFSSAIYHVVWAATSQ